MSNLFAMNAYIGTKLITARPMTRGAYNDYRGWTIPADENPEDEGYLVHYSDNYESWSPKVVFEEAYLPLVVNPDLKTSKPSISQQMVDDFIVNIDVWTMAGKTTVVRATLRNGFEILEASACVSKENYDEKLGAQICLGKIKDKVWMLLGFLLQTAVNGINYRDSESMSVEGMCFGEALELAKDGKKIAREGWNGKGMYVFLADEVEFHTEADISEFEGSADGVDVLPVLVMRTAKGDMCPGWLASQSDILADDWYIVE